MVPEDDHDDEISKIRGISNEELAHNYKSPSFTRKLWMKTPFSSFSSDSTVGTLPLKETQNLQSLRLKLQVYQFNFDNKSDEMSETNLNRGGFLRGLINNEASIRANNRRRPLQGPLRVLRLCVLSIIFPGILVGVPLYMRYFVYGEQAYPVGMSDMRLLDHRVSTLWCQGQTVWSNATFNAYLMSRTPSIQKERERVSMTRVLDNLEDDSKEYWGFYLLKDSTITVSACARYPGSSMIMIRGHKHLRDCAFIGDNSSEELEERYPDDVNSTESNDNNNDPPNKPAHMTRLTDGVTIHGKFNFNTNKSEFYQRKTSHSTSDSSSNDKPQKIQWLGGKVGNTHLAFAAYGNKLAKEYIENEKLKQNKSDLLKKTKKVSNKDNAKSSVNEPPTIQSSKEIYEGILKRLENLGEKGKRILKRLHSKDSFKEITTNMTDDLANSPTDSPEEDRNREHKIRHNKKLNDKKSNESKVSESEIKRERRDLLLNALHGGEQRDAALEEEAHQDGIAQMRKTINETSPFDKSNSEFWSSFSSSEERLLNCEGLLVNLPLRSSEICNENLTGHHQNDLIDSISYRVTSNGYYFFVFNSENEIKPNFLRIHFRLDKAKYDVSQPVASCRNQTDPCSLPLTFWSEQKVVLQVPVGSNDALWNQEFLAVSTCEPRTAIYMVCVIAVPLFIILFAFQ